MKKWIIALLLMTIPYLLWGCKNESGAQAADAAPKIRMVVSIDVTCDPEDPDLARHYNAPEKLDAVLSYLRGLEPSSELEGDPETCEGSQYQIIMNYVSGATRTYTQVANQYFQEEGRAWEQLRESDGKTLESLLESLNSDP